MSFWKGVLKEMGRQVWSERGWGIQDQLLGKSYRCSCGSPRHWKCGKKCGCVCHREEGRKK